MWGHWSAMIRKINVCATDTFYLFLSSGTLAGPGWEWGCYWVCESEGSHRKYNWLCFTFPASNFCWRPCLASLCVLCMNVLHHSQHHQVRLNSVNSARCEGVINSGGLGSGKVCPPGTPAWHSQSQTWNHNELQLTVMECMYNWSAGTSEIVFQWRNNWKWDRLR